MDADSDPFEPILTERLRLRCLTPEDAAGLAATLTPEVVERLASWPPVVTSEIAAARIAENRRRMRDDGDLMSFGVERRSDGLIVGGVGARVKAETPDRAEIGYHLGSAHHGLGYGFEATAALVRAVWSLTQVSLIEACAQPDNHASFAIMRKLGMEPAGEVAVFSSGRDRWEVCRNYALRRSAT
ncbi:GNAT family N-acetyltransferase [Caulobacter sp. NIBR2454]|uniref:GNAT family N-acetyltransferase n=1 Tax=Caulobacter sp. NIBR2454 TaxID=3015996 RepID=UPI0022B7022A|nr:GNAT family N-acetyltransferase [Caulobacter sp. NIBR2454]